MKANTERSLMRWVHIILSIPIIGYFYGPVATQYYAALATKFGFVPLVILSGFWMWKGHMVKRWFKNATKPSKVQSTKS